MINRIVFISFLFCSSNICGQQIDCKVIVPEISGSYTGGCKNGLASGKGIAQGIDSYEGQFSKGMPNGKGIYKWANGTWYEGQWKDGIKEGLGKMVLADSVVIGYWKDGKYVGDRPARPYKITRSMAVSRYTISKSPAVGNGAKIRIMPGRDDSKSVEGFSLAMSSGEEYRVGDVYGIQNSFLPLDIKIMYRTWNMLHTTLHDVIFEVTIFEPGTWDIAISN
jgi:hypothetical protein